MKPYNNSPVIPKKTGLRKPQKPKGKRKSRPGMFSNDKTGSKELLTVVGNTAPWTTNVAPTGSKTSSGANKKRTTKKPVKTRKTKPAPTKRNKIPNRAPRARTPVMGNTNNAGMWGM